MLLHHKIKQTYEFRQDKICGTKLFKTVLKFSEMTCRPTILCGHIGNKYHEQSLTESAEFTIPNTGALPIWPDCGTGGVALNIGKA